MRFRRASAEGNAEYLGCADSVPLSQRVAELEKKMTILETKGNNEWTLK